jgi:hypothetical protein
MTSQDRKTRPVAKRQAARPGADSPETAKPQEARPQAASPEATKKLEIKYAPVMKALGMDDIDFMIGLVGQISNAGSDGRERDPVGVNFRLSVIKGIQPRDQIEAMLASQMAAVHMASMTLARRLAHVEDIRQQDSAQRALTNLTRTFAAQMEALKRYRTSGEQKITVQHVTVSDGGQAIVGNVTHSLREVAANKSAASQPLLADAKMPPMPIIEENKEAPVPALKKNEE